MKAIVNLYNTNTYFHSLVLAIEAALISFVTSYNGGIPTTKAAWLSVLFALGGAIWGAVKRYLASNAATKSVPLAGEQLTTVIPGGPVLVEKAVPVVKTGK